MKRIKIIFGILLIILKFNQINAQGDSLLIEKAPKISTGCIGLNAGIGFASEDFGDPDIGGAISGPTYQLTFGIPFVGSHFGIAGKTSYGTYSMTNQPFFTQQMQLYKKYELDTDVTYNKITNLTIKQLSFLAGAYGTIPLGRFSIDGRVLFGPTRITRPKVNIEITDQDNNVTTYTQYAQATTTFLYDFGLGFRVNLLESEKLCVMVNFDYCKSRSNFRYRSDGMYTDDLDNLRTGNHLAMDSYSIGYYTITAGIGYVW